MAKRPSSNVVTVQLRAPEPAETAAAAGGTSSPIFEERFAAKLEALRAEYKGKSVPLIGVSVHRVDQSGRYVKVWAGPAETFDPDAISRSVGRATLVVQVRVSDRAGIAFNDGWTSEMEAEKPAPPPVVQAPPSPGLDLSGVNPLELLKWQAEQLRALTAANASAATAAVDPVAQLVKLKEAKDALRSVFGPDNEPESGPAAWAKLVEVAAPFVESAVARICTAIDKVREASERPRRRQLPAPAAAAATVEKAPPPPTQPAAAADPNTEAMVLTFQLLATAVRAGENADPAAYASTIYDVLDARGLVDQVLSGKPGELTAAVLAQAPALKTAEKLIREIETKLRELTPAAENH